MKKTGMFLLLVTLLPLVGWQEKQTREVRYDRARLVAEFLKDKPAREYVESVSALYRQQLDEVKKKYPIVYDRMQLTDMALVSRSAEVGMMRADRRYRATSIYCLFYYLTRSEAYRVLCRGDSLTIVGGINRCGDPFSHLKIKFGPDGSIIEGCDLDCAFESWQNCMNNPRN